MYALCNEYGLRDIEGFCVFFHEISSLCLEFKFEIFVPLISAYCFLFRVFTIKAYDIYYIHAKRVHGIYG